VPIFQKISGNGLMEISDTSEEVEEVEEAREVTQDGHTLVIPGSYQ
jgi:hypothetical protein